MKPIKSLILFLTILAMFFAFTSCKKKEAAPANDVNIEESKIPLEDDGKELSENEAGSK